MKQYNKQILEVINRGIRLTIDDIEDIDDSISSKSGIIQNDGNSFNGMAHKLGQ